MSPKVRRPFVRSFAFVSLLALALPAFALDVDRNPQDYLLLGLRRTRVKDLKIAAPGCNVGVDCPFSRVGDGCGMLTATRAVIPAPGQVVGDKLCITDGHFFEVFRGQEGACSLGCSLIDQPGANADCSEPFVPPIIGDLDMDGQPSCGADCAVDPDDVALACGVTLPFPPCDPARPVTVVENADCIGVPDAVPGNFRCDLPAGSYGAIRIENAGRLLFAGGTTVFCSLDARSNTHITSAGPATLLVPGSGAVRLLSGGEFGTECGVLRLATERGLIKLGKHSTYTVDACSIGGLIDIGGDNMLRGHFVGSVVGSDFGNSGGCCPTTTSTVTTTSTTSSTTSSSSSTTSSSSSSSSSSSTTSSSSTSTSSSSSTSETTTSTSSTRVTATEEVSSSSTVTSSSTSTSTSTSSSSSSSSSSTSSSSSSSTSSTHSTSSTSSTSTSSSTSSSTSTTAPGFTRTPGFYKNHPAVTQRILDDAGGLTVCGKKITDVAVNDAHSALEALCISPQGNQRLQLFRQLLTAALNDAAGTPATFTDFAACDALCQDAGATDADLSACVDAADAFNNSGDNVTAPFEPAGAAVTAPCKSAADTACTVLAPASCAVH